MAVLLAGGCEPTTRYQVLTTFFDEVPPPGYEAPPRKPKRSLRPTGTLEDKKPEVVVTKPVEPAEPPVMEAENWEELLALLPRASTGGADWVAAVETGIVAPRGSLNPEERTPLPFPLDVDLSPGEPFTVRFPHFSHTLWLDCTNCHPDVFKMKRGAHDIEMSDVFEGRYCGKCHGKIAFSPETSCVRCHTQLRPPQHRAEVIADLTVAASSTPAANARTLRRGKSLYATYCEMCHGRDGDGAGRAADELYPRPRDFRQGKYKFRTTPGGELPTDFDIFRTITVGVPGTSMPSWRALKSSDRWALVHYVKTFSDRFKTESISEPLMIEAAVPRTDELFELGRELFVDAGCNGCHGDTGDGNGPSAAGLDDDWGYPIRPFAFAGGGPRKSGPAPEDAYRTIMTGLDGTPMPTFGDVLDPEMTWALVYYIASLAEGGGAQAASTVATAGPGIPRPSEASVQADLAAARAAPNTSDPTALATGSVVYQQQCAVCHGEAGDGAGMAAATVEPKPRDFRQGKYKFRTTPGGTLPTDYDIFRTITVGVPGTSMPGWGVLPFQERWALVEYLKTFSPRFSSEEPEEPLEIPEPPPPTPALLDEGSQLWADAGCNSCHGDEGRGNGPSAEGLEDDWGFPIRPANFARGGPLKSGSDLKDLYRTIMTGLDGTPMPSFGDVLEPEMTWALVYFVRTLSPAGADAAVEGE